MSWVVRFLDLGTAPDDERDLRIRKRTAVATLLLVTASSAIYLVVSLLGNRIDAAVIAVLQIAAQLLNLVLFRRHRRLQPMVVALIVLGLLVLASGVLTFGGLVGAGGNVFFGILAPLGAVLLLGRRAAVPALAAYFVLVAFAAAVDPFLRDAPRMPYPLLLLLSVVNVVVPSAIAVGLVVFIDGERLEARARSDALLVNILPRSIADRLQRGEGVIAEHHDEVTVLFSDVVDFTPFAEAQAPQRVVEVLNELFTAFDRLAEHYALEKIKTIGDAYMVVAGVPLPRDDHAAVMLEMALAMHADVAARPPIDGREIQLRTGIASGPVVAGVIGSRKFSYDLWGDTVNTASRMESSGVAGCIQVTPATYQRSRTSFPFRRRDDVEVKGKGRMTTWLLDPADVVPPVPPSGG